MGVKTRPSVSYSKESSGGICPKSQSGNIVLTRTSNEAEAVLIIPLMTPRAFSRRLSSGKDLRSSPLMHTASKMRKRVLPARVRTSSPSSRVSLGIRTPWTLESMNARFVSETPSSVLARRCLTPSVFSHTK